ncbi:hypothetical protein C8J57DRAFT_1513219 [Mycena rebaudengoi]|nr:hypothetical protein C8J57DRAFT_1513219 [Mycena rebaudengoi]
MPHQALLGTHAPLARTLLRPAAPAHLALRFCQIIHQVRRWRIRERRPVFSKHAQGQMHEYGDESAEGPGWVSDGCVPPTWCPRMLITDVTFPASRRCSPTILTGVHHVLYTPHQHPRVRRRYPLPPSVARTTARLEPSDVV